MSLTSHALGQAQPCDEGRISTTWPVLNHGYTFSDNVKATRGTVLEYYTAEHSSSASAEQ